jgi:tRNA nucleotidyltransferase/poly(A) polymerase
LRLLRAIRFAVRLGFAIEPATYAAIRRGAAGLARISRERVASELRQILTGHNPERGIALLMDSGLMPYILGGVRIELPTDTRIADLPADYPTRLAALLWHANPETAHAALVSLKPSGEESHAVMTLLDDRSPLDPANTPVSAATARRLRHRYGALARTRQILRAAYAPTADDRAAEEKLAELIEASAAAREPVTAAELALGGRDLIALGVPAGPAVGQVVARLLDAVLDDPARNTPDALSELVRKFQSE